MRDWLNSILGEESGRIAQLALAFITVILLILVLAWVARRLLPGARLAGPASGKPRKRLGVIEASDVDARRRLVLVRRDDVEHLVMIGGPNDILIESRIIRGMASANGRPNVQKMPQPNANEAERLAAANPPSVENPVGPVYAVPNVASSSAAAPDIAAIDLPSEAASMPQRPTVPAPPAQTQPIYARPSGMPALPTAGIQPAPDLRRPSLNDIIGAAAAAKAAEPRSFAQPVAAPAPPAPAHPDLEDDDRDTPTQIVAQRPVLTQFVPPAHSTAAPRATQQPAMHPPITAAPDRETEVATQIERALADLNPLAETAPRLEPRPDQVTRGQPAQRMPVTAANQTPQSAPPVTVAVPAEQARPVSVAPIPTMPPIPQRTTFGSRPMLSERPSPGERPQAPVEAVDAPRRDTSRYPDNDFHPTVPPTLSHPTIPPEPVTAPRPIIPSAGPTSQPSVTPELVAVPRPTDKQKVDELEEEMAKLLSELGGTSSR